MNFRKDAKVKGILMFDASAERLIRSFLNQSNKVTAGAILDLMGVKDAGERAAALGMFDGLQEMYRASPDKFFDYFERLDSIEEVSEKLIEMCIHYLRMHITEAVDKVLEKGDRKLH